MELTRTQTAWLVFLVVDSGAVLTSDEATLGTAPVGALVRQLDRMSGNCRLQAWRDDEPIELVITGHDARWQAHGTVAAVLAPFAEALAAGHPDLLHGADLAATRDRIDHLPPPDDTLEVPAALFDNRHVAGDMAANPLWQPWEPGDGERYQQARLADAFRSPHSGPIETVTIATLVSVQPAVNRSRLRWMTEHPEVVDVPVRVLEVDGRTFLTDGTHRAVLAQLAGLSAMEARVWRDHTLVWDPPL